MHAIDIHAAVPFPDPNSSQEDVIGRYSGFKFRKKSNCAAKG